MIRHIWSVYCSKGSVDQQTNAVSLFEVIEEFQLQVPPGTSFPLAVPNQSLMVTYWAREDSSEGLWGQQRLRFLAPDGGELGQFAAKINLDAASRSRNFARFEAIRFGGPGRHEWEVAWRVSDSDDWKVVARIPVDVIVTFVELKGGDA
jgi:hypothetical protein